MDMKVWTDTKWNELNSHVQVVARQIERLIEGGNKNTQVKVSEIKISLSIAWEQDIETVKGLKTLIFLYIVSAFKTLTCITCSDHAMEYLIAKGFPINEYKTWSKWLYDMRRHIASLNGTHLPSYEDYMIRYDIKTTFFNKDDLIDSLIFTVYGFFYRDKSDIDPSEVYKIYKLYILVLVKLLPLDKNLKKLKGVVYVKDKISRQNDLWEWVKDVAIRFIKQEYNGINIFKYKISSFRAFEDSI